jgi:hypothetical protein
MSLGSQTKRYMHKHTYKGTYKDTCINAYKKESRESRSTHRKEPTNETEGGRARERVCLRVFCVCAHVSSGHASMCALVCVHVCTCMSVCMCACVKCVHVGTCACVHLDMTALAQAVGVRHVTAPAAITLPQSLQHLRGAARQQRTDTPRTHRHAECS